MSESNDNWADALYNSDASVRSGFEPAIAEGLGQLADINGWSQADRDAHATSLSHAFNDARLTGSEASIVLSHVVAYSKAPPDAATRERLQTEARSALRGQYGSITEADRRVEVAREFLANHPELRELLTTSGAANHPAVVRLFAEKAGAQGSRYAMRVTPAKRGK